MAKAWMLEKRRRMARDARTPTVARPDLQQPYGEWIGRLPWDWWATFTFPVMIHADEAVQRYGVWAEALAAETGNVMRHVRALEYQRRGVIHFHSLIWNVTRTTSKNRWMFQWQEIGGGWAEIKQYSPAQGAPFYLGKYVVKGGEIDHLTFGKSSFKPDDVRIRRAVES